MVGKKNNSLQGKKFCEPCGKDISTSYFSKHLKTIGHQRNADKSPAPPQESSDESDASVSSSSGDELKLDKIISSSEEEESESEQEQEQEQPVDEKKDTSQSEQEEESEESEQESEEEEEESEPSPEPSPEPVKKSKRVKKNVKVKVEKQKSKPKPKKAGLYALSSSEEEDNSVNPSGFLKFVNTLSNDFDITQSDDIKKVFNSVMGFGKSSYHINPSVKNQLSRYLNKYERDNSHLDENLVHNYLSEFLSNY